MLCTNPKLEEKPDHLTFNDYDKFSATTDQSNQDPAVINPPWLYYLVKLQGEIGELSEKIGKVFRDQAGVFSNEDRRLICLEIGDILWYLTRLAAAFGFGIGYVAARNIIKLAARLEQNKIHGQGDER
jgi:NTP pyrophosphatase (non-canonical NTP hydrolase)